MLLNCYRHRLLSERDKFDLVPPSMLSEIEGDF